MNQAKDPDTLVICKLFPAGSVIETVRNFFNALSRYNLFLKERSGSTGTNLFSSAPEEALELVSLTDAAPVILFTEAAKSLMRCDSVSAVVLRHIPDFDAIKVLRGLEKMVAEYYESSHSLDILDQKIILLQVILHLIPPSQPGRGILYLELGVALAARFTLTHEISDLDCTIAYYRKEHPDDVDPYAILLKLAACTKFRSLLTQSSDDLNETIDILRHILSGMPSHRIRFMCLQDLGTIMMEQYVKDCRSTYLEEAISCHREAFKLCHLIEDNHTIPSIIKFSSALINGHEVATVKVHASDVVNVIQAFISLDLDTDGDEYTQVSHILTILFSNTRTSDEYSDDMIAVIRTFINTKPSSDFQHFIRLNAFAMLQSERFSSSQDIEDINEAISVYRDTLIYPPPIEVASYDVASIEVLAGLLARRFRHSPADEDAQEIVAIYRDILASSTSNDRIRTMKDFADFLVLRFDSNPQLEDREEALLLYKDALQMMSGNETGMAIRFELLLKTSSTLLLTRENSDENLEHYRTNINEAIHYLKTAISLPGCDSLGNLFEDMKNLISACHLARYRLTNDPADLDASAELASDDDITAELEHIAIDNIRDPEELDELISKLRRSLTVQPFPHPSRPETLTSLGNALAVLFKLGGPVKHVNEAIIRLREAISLSPKSIVARKALLKVLFEKLKEENFNSVHHYIDEMEDIMRQCLLLDPRPMDPGVQLEHKRRAEHYDELLTANDRMTLLHATSTTRGISLEDRFEDARIISTMYWMEFTISDDIEHLNSSIDFSREAAIKCSDDHPRGAAIYHDFGIRLLRRYDILNTVEDLDESLQCLTKSIHMLPPKSYYTALYYAGLGLAMWYKLGYLSNYEAKDEFVKTVLSVAVSFRAAVESSASPAPIRFQTARVWASITSVLNDDSAIEAYQQAINLLPRLSSMATSLTTRQEAFNDYEIDGISRRAALFAIRVKRYNKAVEFLEAGRAVFWLQALQLRSPMDKLRDLHPEFHYKLSSLSAELEEASMTTFHVPGSNIERQHQDEEIFRLEELNEEWARTLDEIHKLEDFKDFLLPQSLPELQASTDCPVIYLIEDHNQSHALIIFSDNILHVDLKNADCDKLHGLASTIPGAGSYAFSGPLWGPMRDILSDLKATNAAQMLDENHRLERKGDPRHFNRVDDEDKFRHVLEVLWNDVVGPILQELRPHMSESHMKVYWCPTGIFSFLPLHAAGIYRNDMSSIECASDYLISSYTPTISAISRKPISNTTPDEFKMMVVVDPIRLPSTIHEMEVIERHVDTNCLIRMGTQGSPAYVEKVASNLSHISIAHFACHGKQNEQPLDSSLVLHDGNLKISRIMEERMPNAALAFLCACETAMGDQKLPDEAMHLGATLLYSGFRSVVATMWSIDDEDGPVVADRFYAHLFKDDPKRPDISLSAEAVHYAIIALREKGVGFKRWVPFVHLGV